MRPPPPPRTPPPSAPAPLLELGQQLVQQHQLPAVFHQVLPRQEGRPRLRALEEVGVVAALAQLHDDVQEAAAVGAAVEGLDVLLEQRGVPLGGLGGCGGGG